MALMKIRAGKVRPEKNYQHAVAGIDVITVELSRTLPPVEIDVCWYSRIEVIGGTKGEARVLRLLVMNALLKDTELFAAQEGVLRK